MELQEKKFQKKSEDFICQKCGMSVRGGGYTDHCPNCLWSKHLDIYPGDRKEKCGGLMKPIGIIIENGEFIIYYKCQKCGYKFRVKSAANDNFEEILKLLSQPF